MCLRPICVAIYVGTRPNLSGWRLVRARSKTRYRIRVELDKQTSRHNPRMHGNGLLHGNIHPSTRIFNFCRFYRDCPRQPVHRQHNHRAIPFLCGEWCWIGCGEKQRNDTDRCNTGRRIWWRGGGITRYCWSGCGLSLQRQHCFRRDNLLPIWICIAGGKFHWAGMCTEW